ncbi:hypothetical protein, partial [Prevotella sp. BV3P1]|uniref:hypothetical protein n=1 Tax=Prevotella sp. BV3P1 TaxID=1111130 RepID=UPI001E596F07
LFLSKDTEFFQTTKALLSIFHTSSDNKHPPLPKAVERKSPPHPHPANVMHLTIFVRFFLNFHPQKWLIKTFKIEKNDRHTGGKHDHFFF